METINKQTIILDLRQTSTVPIPSFIQHDTNILEIIIKDNGADADLSSIDNVTVNYKRPDGQTLTTRIQPKGNVLTYQFGNEEMTVGGYGELNIQLFTNNTRLSTKRLKVYFAKSLGAAFENSAGFPLLQELFVEVEEVTKATTEAGHYALDKGNIAEEKAAEAEAAAANANQETANLSGLKSTLSAATKSADNATKEAITQAEYAKTQAELSKEQAAYAKKEADRLVGTDVSVLDNNIKKVVSELADTAKIGDLTNAVEELNAVNLQKASITYVNQQLQAANLAWKESHPTLSQLQTSYPTGDTYNHVVLADGMIYTWINNTWKNTQILAAGINIPKNSVTPDKTVMFLPTKNLLDVSQLINGYTDFTTGVFLTHATFRVTPYIRVTSGLSYLTNKLTRAYAFYDSNQTFISSIQNTTANQVVVAPINAVFMRVTFSGNVELGDAQIEQSTKPTSYTTPYYLAPDYVKSVDGQSITSKTLGIEKLSFSKKSSKNIFNYLEDVETSVTHVFPTDGTLTTSINYAYKVTRLLGVLPSKNYTANKKIRSIAFYNSDGVFVSGITAETEERKPFITPSTAAYMRCNISSSSVVLSEVQIEQGSVSTSFEPYYYIPSFVQPKSITANELADGILQTRDSKWTGKTFVSLGTSIPWYDGKTYPDGVTVARGYQTHLKEKLGFASYTNAAVSGSSMANGTSEGTNGVGKKINYANFDLVTIEAASNDFKLDVPLGVKGISSDTTFDTTTFYGAYRDLIQYILTQKPTIRIVIFTPPRRKQAGYTDQSANAVGNVMFDYVKAVYEIGELYGLPVVDFWKDSGFNWYTAPTFTIDGVHPNNIGFERLGAIAVERIRNQ